MSGTAVPVDESQPPGLGTPAHADGPSTVVRALVGIALGLATGGLAASLIPRQRELDGRRRVTGR